jgi:hypothetical protein
MAAMAIICILLSAFFSLTGAALTEAELVDMVRDLKGTDTRMMRWDATEYTAERQEGGACEKMPEAAAVIKEGSKEDNLRALLACEYATFCITDNPYQRAQFSKVHGIHKAVVELVKTGTPQTSAMASHLIYISSFTNEKNQQGYFKAHAVDAVGVIILNRKALAVQSMWAMAALSNMAASYCATKADGRCYWTFTKDQNYVVIGEDSLPIISDGTAIRQAAMQIPGLIAALTDSACQGPVKGTASDEYILPGDNAVAGRDDANPAIVPWAATSALKNLAVEPAAKPLMEGPALACYCRLKDSYDWLEENKGEGILLHLRPHDPCWNESDDDEPSGVCVDGYLLDEEGYYCEDYGQVTDDECEAKDVFSGVKAAELCCGCGGGERFNRGRHEEL